MEISRRSLDNQLGISSRALGSRVHASRFALGCHMDGTIYTSDSGVAHEDVNSAIM